MSIYNEILQEKEFYIILHNSTKKILEMRWLVESERMSLQEFKDALLLLNTLVAKHKPSLLIADLKDLVFGINPDLQHWILKEIIKKGYTGYKKLAILVSEDIFTQISIEQMFNDFKEMPFEIKYFTHSKEANYWLVN